MNTQPTPDVTGADVERVVRRDFPAGHVAGVLALLDEYGTESWHREIDRVRLAALKLAGGRLDGLRLQVEGAKCDYRDLLAAAEYPGYCRLVPPSGEPPSGEAQRIIDADWRQYQDWLNR